jgi:hypothetical protein
MIIVDGHNLIPKIRGLDLSMLDDEQKLIQILQEYSRLSRKKIEVYFDGAPPQQTGTRKFGTIIAHFITEKSTADAAIIQRVRNMGKKTSQITVVSSDAHIQDYVRRCHAQSLPSDEFAKEVEKVFFTRPSGPKPDAAKMSAEELDKWLDLFNNEPDKSG